MPSLLNVKLMWAWHLPNNIKNIISTAYDFIWLIIKKNYKILTKYLHVKNTKLELKLKY